MSPRQRNKKKIIGFIGLGLMGRAFSRNLIADGHALVGTDPSLAARRRFRALGGRPLASPREVAEAAEIVFISVPNSKIALETAKGKDGHLAFAPGKTPQAVIDTTTSDPSDSRRHAALCRRKGVPYLDASVSGNSAHVAKREGTFLVGGDRKAYMKAKPLMNSMLSDCVYCGPSGAGASIKVAVNYLTSMGRCVIAETLRLGLRCGFKKEFFLEALLRSRAGGWQQLRNMGPRMIRQDFAKPDSTVDVLAKDIRLGLTLAARVGAQTPIGSAGLPLYEECQRAGYGGLDSTALYLAYVDRERRKGRARRR